MGRPRRRAAGLGDAARDQLRAVVRRVRAAAHAGCCTWRRRPRLLLVGMGALAARCAHAADADGAQPSVAEARARFMAIGGLILCAWFAAGDRRHRDPCPGAPSMHPVGGGPRRAGAAPHGLGLTSVSHWELEPLVVRAAGASRRFSTRSGVARLWRRAGIGRGISSWSAVSFAAGMAHDGAGAVSPVAWVSQILFSIHMTQHMLLMLVAAPLLTFGQPLLAWMWTLRRRAAAARRPGVPRAASRESGAPSRRRWPSSCSRPSRCGCGTFHRGTKRLCA